jgi:hypothetical protein
MDINSKVKEAISYGISLLTRRAAIAINSSAISSTEKTAEAIDL